MYLLKKYGIWRAPYAAWAWVGMLKTWSSSSRVLPLVSGRKNRTRKKPTMFQPAYQLKAPWVVKAICRLGQVIERIKLKNQVVAVAARDRI